MRGISGIHVPKLPDHQALDFLSLRFDRNGGNDHAHEC